MNALGTINTVVIVTLLTLNVATLFSVMGLRRLFSQMALLAGRLESNQVVLTNIDRKIDHVSRDSAAMRAASAAAR